MGRLVLVGVPVPVGAVGPPRLLLARPAGARPGRAAAGGPPRPATAYCATWQVAGMDVDFSDLTPWRAAGPGRPSSPRPAGERSVVRIYRPGRRDDAAPEIDAAVLRLVRGLVPVPDVLEVRRGTPAADRPGLLVTSFLPGERGDLLLPTPRRRRRAALGAQLGGLARGPRPACRPCAAGPFVDADLTIGDFGGGRRAAGVRRATRRRPALGTATCSTGSGAVAADAQALLDTVGRPASCTPTSTRRTSSSTRTPSTVTGAARLGVRPLRPPVHRPRQPAALRPPTRRTSSRAGRLVRPPRRTPAEALTLARAADLWALVDLAARRGENPVADRAHEHLRGHRSDKRSARPAVAGASVPAFQRTRRPRLRDQRAEVAHPRGPPAARPPYTVGHKGRSGCALSCRCQSAPCQMVGDPRESSTGTPSQSRRP